MSDDFLDNLIVTEDNFKIPWDEWCHYKRLAIELSLNCPDSHFGLCLYTILFEHSYPAAKFFKKFGYKILKADNMDNELIYKFTEKYVENGYQIS